MTELLDFVRRMGEDAGGTASALEILTRVTLLLLAAMLVVVALRRSSAALRHLVWTLSLVGTLLIPLAYWAIPAWQWAILPQRQQQSLPAPIAAIASVTKDVSSQSPLESESSPHASDASADESFEIPAGSRVIVGERFTETSPAIMAKPVPSADFSAPVVARRTWSWSVVLGVIWILGSFLGLVWLEIGIAGAWYVARRAQPAADLHWRHILSQLLAQYGFRRPMEVRECPQVSIPMTWGLRRPVILVPTTSATWSDETKRSVLLHELGHIRRGDCLMHLLGRLACAAYWFHPLVWLAARKLRKTSEQAADDVVLSAHIAPLEYAEHLVDIAAQMRGLHGFGHVALPMASTSDLESRVLAILNPQRNHRSLTRKACYALLLLATLLLIPCAVLRLGYAEEKKATLPLSQPVAAATANPDVQATLPPSQPVAAPTANPNVQRVTPVSPERSVHGRVTGPDGKPVEGATVRPAQYSSAASHPTKTDAQGRFQISDSILRAICLIVEADNYGPGYIEIPPGEEAKLVAIQLTPPATLRGRVVDSAGKPIAGVRVNVNRWRNTFVRSFTATTDQDGRFDPGKMRPTTRCFSASSLVTWIRSVLA